MKKYRIRYFEGKSGYAADVLMKEIVISFENYADAMKYAVTNTPNRNYGVDVIEIQ